MALPTLARKVAKVIFFALILFSVIYSLGNPEFYVNHALASQVAQLVDGDLNAESIYDAYFYIDVISVITLSVIIYLITMKLIKKIRS